MLDVIALILTVIGGINWGLIGISSLISSHGFSADRAPFLSRIIYTLVGIAAV